MNIFRVTYKLNQKDDDNIIFNTKELKLYNNRVKIIYKNKLYPLIIKFPNAAHQNIIKIMLVSFGNKKFNEKLTKGFKYPLDINEVKNSKKLIINAIIF